MEYSEKEIREETILNAPIMIFSRKQQTGEIPHTRGENRKSNNDLCRKVIVK